MKSEDAMYGAITRGDTDAVQRVMQEDPSVLTVFAVKKSWLHWAAQKGNTEIMSTLVAAGLPIDCLTSDGSSTPLNVAAGQAKVEACKWLIDHGADINRGLGELATPIFSAIYGKSLETVRMFVENGADVNAVFGDQGINVITYSEQFGTPEIVEFLKKYRS